MIIEAWMKLRPQAFLSIVLAVFFIVFVYQAKDWRLQARLYPWAIGIPMLILAVIQVILDLKGIGPKQTASDAPVDVQLAARTDPALARRRTINIFSWIIGYLVAVWLLGFAYCVPLIVFLYLKLQSREGWPLSLALTATAWLVFYGLFDRLLHLPFPDGELFTWLGWV
ncbi:MAG TPA: tripartite tricarboxylate transporter TctB family protein [Verrucomicrobiae bacterium]|jgi:Tripartite tricarboxylate transporter TctB family|nr:tripartite tricarboxylate transporter TctB family protein [Verrucomicrobiae bacterium]